MNHPAYHITAFGEILIDFTQQGKNDSGQTLFAQNAGGAPANVLVAAGHQGSRVAFLGKAGEDMHGHFLRSVLEAEGVDVSGFRLDDSCFTTLAFVALSQSGERSFSFARKPGADTRMEVVDLELDVIRNSRIFHVGSLSLTHQPSRDTTYFALEYARKKGVIVSYDPNYRATLWEDETIARAEMRKPISMVDVMKVSDEELSLLTDQTTPECAAQSLLNQGVKIVVVTLGGEGAYVANAQGGCFVPGFISHVVDTTGAGDAFWGGFLHKISGVHCPLENISLEELRDYTRFANALASLCVEHSGAIPAMPSVQAVAERLK